MEKPEKRIKAILREWKVWLVVLIVGVILGAFLYARIYPLVTPPARADPAHRPDPLPQRGLLARARGGRAGKRVAGLCHSRQGDRLQPRLP